MADGAVAATCSNGHESEWDDYCSVCGESLSGTSEAPEGPASEAPVPEVSEVAEAALSCPNCSEVYAAGDIFCENCGYDFLSGTLPDEVEPAAEPAAASTGGTATISVDLAFFERMQFAGVEPPAEIPEPVTIDLPPTDVLVGRHSERRGTFPEIDLASVFGEDSPATDPAVSSSHCRLHRGASGWTITDLDSTNGTFLADDTDPLTPGRPMSLMPGTVIYVGAWTRIELS